MSDKLIHLTQKVSLIGQRLNNDLDEDGRLKLLFELRDELDVLEFYLDDEIYQRTAPNPTGDWLHESWDGRGEA